MMAAMKTMDAQTRAKRIHAILAPLHPDDRPLLTWRSPFELLVSVILSAQCTDDQVNALTPLLFGRWPNPSALAAAGRAEVEALIRPAGFFRVKAAYIRGSAQALLDKHGGSVPSSMEDLTALPGVGRKSANLIRSACFGLPGIIADTHFTRVLYRTGVCSHRDPGKQEEEIASALPSDLWTAFSHAVNRHGKFVCTARRPACAACPIASLCLRRGLNQAEGGGSRTGASLSKSHGKKPR